MPHAAPDPVDDSIRRLEAKIDHLTAQVARLQADLDAGLAQARRAGAQEFKQLKQAIVFWGGRARALDDRRRV